MRAETSFQLDAVTVQSSIDQAHQKDQTSGTAGVGISPNEARCGRFVAHRVQDKTSCHNLYSWAVVRGPRFGSFRSSNATTSTKYYQCRSGGLVCCLVIFAFYSPILILWKKFDSQLKGGADRW
jgi:hypothetical protein